MPLQYSAARTSIALKRSPTKSPIKKFQREAKKLLPSQRLYQQNRLAKSSVPSLSPSPSSLESHASQSSQSPQSPQSPSRSRKPIEKLVVSDYNVELDYQLSKDDDIKIAIDIINLNRWSESTELHDKQKLRHLEGNTTEEVIFQIKGLSLTSKAELVKFRLSFPRGIVTINQLYSIFSAQGNTFVDKQVELNVRQGLLRKFVLNNASPVILRSINRHQMRKVTYGYENVELLVKTEDYYKNLINIVESTDKENEKLRLTMSKFLNLAKSSPLQMFISTSLFDDYEVSTLIQMGYLTLTTNCSSSEEAQLEISYPGCGRFLRLINEGRMWLVGTLNRNTHKEMLEDELFRKWMGVSLEGDLKLNNFKKPFYGYDLHWVLADAFGGGIVEVFNTLVGRGWRLTGKI